LGVGALRVKPLTRHPPRSLPTNGSNSCSYPPLTA